MAAVNWMPRPWNAELAGCIWLPRLLDKGRRLLASERQGQDLMNGYLFGDFDYADGQLLRFLRMNDARVRQLLRELDDERGSGQSAHLRERALDRGDPGLEQTFPPAQQPIHSDVGCG